MREIACGGYGCVYEIPQENVAVKFQEDGPEARNEKEIGAFLAQYFLAPKFFGAFSDNGLAIQVMDNCGETLHSLLVKNNLSESNLLKMLRELFVKKILIGFVHGDLHPGNICIKKKNAVFIDFGLSYFSFDHEIQVLDVFYLVGTMKLFYPETKTFTTKLAQLVHKLFKIPGMLEGWYGKFSEDSNHRLLFNNEDLFVKLRDACR